LNPLIGILYLWCPKKLKPSSWCIQGTKIHQKWIRNENFMVLKKGGDQKLEKKKA
jgi:hypothetical protein